ncbi:MAG: DUF6049 family protein [Acidimicrobiales bacterium]
MSIRPPGRATGRAVLATVVAMVAASMGMASIGTAGAAQDEPSGPGPIPAPASIALVDRSPWVAADGTIELTVATEGPAEPLLLRARVHEPLDSVEDLDRSSEQDVGSVVHRSAVVPVGFVPPDSEGNRVVRIPTSVDAADARTARLRDPGVYPVVVTLEDASGPISEIRTPVIRLGTGDEPLLAPRLQLLVDLAVPPTIEPDGRRALTDDELDRLDGIASLMNGVTTGAGGALDLSVAVPPDTLDALTISSDPRATAVLDALAADDVDRTALGLATVPVSAAALVESELDLLLVALLQEGRTTLDDRLPTPIDRTLWDGTAGIDPASAAVLDGAGVTHVLLDGPTQDSDTVAGERRLIDAGPYQSDETGALDVLLADQGTSTALTARATDRADAAHLAAADLLLRDAGHETRVVIRVAEALDDSLLLPVLELLTAPGSPIDVGPLSTTGRSRSPQDEDEEAAAIERVEVPDATSDLTDVAPRVRETSRAIDSFAGLVGTESARADALRLRVATSVANGIDHDARMALLDAVAGDVDDAFDGVTLSGQTDLNLTSRSGALPLQIHNANDFPVDVVLQISSDRLRFPEGQRFEIAADQEITRVDIPVRAQATGSVPTFVRLTTPDGQIVLDERQLDVRSTAVSGVGLALSLGALVVLVVWWARSWRRSRATTD